MEETKKRPDWRNFPFEDEEAAIRHLKEHAASPEALEKALKFYLHMKRNYDEMVRHESASVTATLSQIESLVPDFQAA